jgi:hypothetical protein
MRWFEVPDARNPERVYLRRLRLIQTPWFGLYLHWIYAPDRDRDPHDHPWWFASWVLRGGYVEDVWTTRLRWRQHVRGRFSVHHMLTHHAHAIKSIEPGTITAVLVGPRCREWGFWTPEGWVHWRRYDRGAA